MNDSDVKPGLKVRVARDNGTTGMSIHPRHLDCRRVGVIGTVLAAVPGHGGDVWFVAQGDTETGAYSFTELEPA